MLNKSTTILSGIMLLCLSLSSFSQEKKEIKLENYVKSDADWIAGKKVRMRTGDESDFRFSCSPLIYQGMCYLDEIIIKSEVNCGCFLISS